MLKQEDKNSKEIIIRKSNNHKEFSSDDDKFSVPKKKSERLEKKQNNQEEPNLMSFNVFLIDFWDNFTIRTFDAIDVLTDRIHVNLQISNFLFYFRQINYSLNVLERNLCV